MCQAYETHWRHDAAPPLTDAQRLAIWVFRRGADGHRPCPPHGTVNVPHIARELLGIAGLFTELLEQPGTIRAMQLGQPFCLAITKDERRLLHVIAAAQTGDDALADNYLYRFALERAARGRLAEAVAKLAACLAVYGYWLPKPAGALTVPGAALTTARAQGHDVRDMRVVWP